MHDAKAAVANLFMEYVVSADLTVEFESLVVFARHGSWRGEYRGFDCWWWLENTGLGVTVSEVN